MITFMGKQIIFVCFIGVGIVNVILARFEKLDLFWVVLYFILGVGYSHQRYQENKEKIWLFFVILFAIALLASIFKMIQHVP